MLGAAVGAVLQSCRGCAAGSARGARARASEAGAGAERRSRRRRRSDHLRRPGGDRQVESACGGSGGGGGNREPGAVGARRRAGARVAVRGRPAAVRAGCARGRRPRARRAPGGSRGAREARALRGRPRCGGGAVVRGAARSLLADDQPRRLGAATADGRRCALGRSSSLRWLVYLARRLEGVPLGLVIAARPAEPGPVQALLDELVAVPEVSVVQLNGLGEPQSSRSQRSCSAPRPSRHSSPPASARPAATRSCSSSSSASWKGADRTDRRERGPGRSAELTGCRSRGSGTPEAAVAGCAALARAVAVLGDPSEPGLAAGLAELDDEDASGAADGLAEAAIFEPAAPLAFAHPLVRSAVYAELTAQARARPRARRAPAHRGRRRPGPDRGAPPGGASGGRRRDGRHPPRGGQGRRNARRAGRGGDVSPPSACRAADARARAGVAHELGRAAISAGELELAVEQLRQATRDLADGRLRAEAANALGSALFLVHRPEEAMTDLTAIIDELPANEREQGLRLQATRWAAARGSVEVWRRLEAWGSGSSSRPAHRGRSASACRSPSRRTRPLERERRPRHASWPCGRLRTGAARGPGSGVGRVLDRAVRARPRPRR